MHCKVMVLHPGLPDEIGKIPNLYYHQKTPSRSLLPILNPYALQ